MLTPPPRTYLFAKAVEGSAKGHFHKEVRKTSKSCKKQTTSNQRLIRKRPRLTHACRMHWNLVSRGASFLCACACQAVLCERIHDKS